MPRKTQQRTAIRRALENADRPLSPREILTGARALAPGLGIATVYRNVRALVAQGWLRAVELPGTASRYELSGKAHHHHFHCRRCDRVYEVEGCPGDIGGLAPDGFQPESHDLTLYGLCDRCGAGA